MFLPNTWKAIFNKCIKIDDNNLLSEKQFGFRANHLTYMAIMQLVDKICCEVEQDQTTI